MTFPKFITFICRIFTGVLFIFSGFVKLVDPLGSAYKFEEYFGSDVLNIEFLIPFSLPFAILLIIVELLLGITLLIGYKKKLTLWSLLTITSLFLFLTGYSAIFDKVTDCGCFGDAVKLTPWETFYKNIIFIFLIVWMIKNQRYIRPVFRKSLSQWILFISLFSSLYVTYHALTYLPLIDFRPYAIGKNIREGMQYKEDGKIPPVHDFYLESDTEDLTESILNAPKVVLIVMNQLEHTEPNSWQTIINFARTAQESNYVVYALSSAGSQEVEQTTKKYQLPFDILFCDGTTLKTMMRANPGILILNNATVIDKFHWKKSNNFNF
ncbi:BT_3928 family protein [Wenyingzhuangia sp. IMCC45533]